MVKAAIPQQAAHRDLVTDETRCALRIIEERLDQIKLGSKDVIEVARPSDKSLDRLGQFVLVGERPFRCSDIP
jgi:hypothetical protein